MPIYEYQCQKCGVVFEKIQIGHGEEDLKCPACGAGKPQRILSGFSSSKGSESFSSCGGGSSRFS